MLECAEPKGFSVSDGHGQKTAVTGYLLSKGNWNKVSGHDIIAKSLVLPLSNANLDWR